MSECKPKDAPRFETINRNQVVLAPLDIEKLIPLDHPARNLWEFLGRLDLSQFSKDIKSVEGSAGRNAWDPRLLIAIWLYAYSRGISSARQIERECEYEPGLRWLTGLEVINHHTLSDFRVRHGEALQELFIQVLGILTMEKLITLERVTLDGTKVRACANKKTFRRADKIHEHMKLARNHLKHLQEQEAEQETRGRKEAARERGAQERVRRLESALREVERLQEAKKCNKAKPCQASTTDPDARFMRTSDHGVAPEYNIQLTTDAQHKLIVDVAVTKEPSDCHELLPALDRMKRRLGQYPKEVLADGDYTTRQSIIGAVDREVDFYGSWPDTSNNRSAHGNHPDYALHAFKYDASKDEMICPEGKRLLYKTTQGREENGLTLRVYVAQSEDCRSCPKRELCTPKNKMEKHGRAVSRPQEAHRVQDFRRKMAGEEGKAIFKLRSPVAEFPHAWLKDKLKWVRVRTRGLMKVTAEALWVTLVYNLQRYFTLRVLVQPR
jgi:transposase